MFDDRTIDFFLEVHDAGEPEPPTAKELEAAGWRTWLKVLVGFAFEEDFSRDHVKFWDLYWSVLFRIRRQRELFASRIVNPYEQDESKIKAAFTADGCWIDPDEYAILLILARGLAKSSTIEAAVIMRGCILGGYAVYVCDTQDQADEHIGNIKILIDSPDSRVAEFYPHMRIDADARWKDKKITNRTDLFITVKGAFICRAKGLNASLRGIRVGRLRPDNICLDDLDNVNDSIAVSIKKLNQLSSAVLPTQARRHATVLGGQNLIGETTVFNQIYTGKSDILTARKVIGVSNAFERFEESREYITKLDEETGRIRHTILPTAVPTWPGVNIAAAQKFLNDSGLDAFLAEYMNSFEHQKTGKVFSEYNEERHIITWDDFERVMGHRTIPGNWQAKASADFGYSKDSLSAWLFTARSAQNAKVPGLYFGYRSKTFMYDSISDQAIEVWKDMFPDPEIGKANFEATQEFARYPELYRVLNADPRCQRYLRQYEYNAIRDRYDLKPLDYEQAKKLTEEEKALFYVREAGKTFKSQISAWSISHEKTGEQKTLAQMYGIPAMKVKRFEADAGVVEANFLLRGDYSRPHPFFADDRVPETGLYRLGCPYIFFIVERIAAPRDDRDFKTFREHVSTQRWTEEKITDTGLTKTVPMKINSDHPDAFRIFACDYALPQSTPKTKQEHVAERLEKKFGVKPAEPGKNTPEADMTRRMATIAATKEVKRDLGYDEDEDF